jgi:MurNAc alpha-1-phosphate uridylyltransferase
MTNITQAFIFAAGRGERMRPLTDTICKPLIKIKNKAIIDYAIEKLDAISSIKKIIINGFYLSEQIENHIKSLGNPKIIFSREFEKLETAGGLVFASNLIDFEQPLLAINGDVLWQENSAISDVKILSDAWNSQDCDVLLGLKKTADYLGYDKNLDGGDFDFDGKNLFRFDEKKMSHVFVGLQIINPKILKNAPEKCFLMLHFYFRKNEFGKNELLKRVSGVELAGKYFHIGTVEAMKNTEIALRNC